MPTTETGQTVFDFSANGMNPQHKYSYINQADYESVAGPDWPVFEDFLNNKNVPDFVFKEIDQMLAPPQEFSHNSFCVLPFYGIEYPTKSFCCLTTPGADAKVVQQQILNNVRPVECGKCWVLEDAGEKSDRLIKNETLSFYTEKPISTLFDECVKNENKIIHYKIDTNNVCNSTCVTCDSNYSSSWAKLETNNNKIPAKTWQIYPDDIDIDIEYSTARVILFRGGEPFMSRTNFHILEKLVEHNNTDCFVGFVTNGSFDLTSKQIELIKKFPRINFCFSIDGVGPVFEYIRYPLNFDKTVNNLNWCKSNGIDISVSYTVSNLNIFYHNQTVDWFEKQNLKFLVNPVYDPGHFRPGALPLVVKQHIQKNLDPNIANLISDHGPADDRDFQKFLVEIAKQDAWKNIQLKYYLPELAALIDQK